MTVNINYNAISSTAFCILKTIEYRSEYYLVHIKKRRYATITFYQDYVGSLVKMLSS